MDNQLLKDTLHLLKEEAEVEVYYYFKEDKTLYTLDEDSLHKSDISFEDSLHLFHPSDGIVFNNNFQSVWSGKTTSVNGVYRRKTTIDDDDYQLFNIHVIAHKPDKGDVDYIFYSIKNINKLSLPQQRLSSMSDKFKTIFTSLPFAAVCFDDEGRVIEANEKAVFMSSQWFGTNIFEVNFLHALEVDDAMRNCFSGKISFIREIRLDNTVADYKIVLLNYVPVSDIDGTFFGHMLIFQDITSEKNIIHSNEIFTKKMKLVTEHFGLIHLDCYPDSRTFSLEGGHSLTHLDHVPIEVAYDMMHPDDRHLLSDIVEDTMSKPIKSYDINYRMHMANHEDYRYVTLSLMPNIDERGRLICYTGLMQDNTERVKELAAKEKMLKELRAAMEKAEESDKLKSAFLANISHEIRTPLNAITGFSELLVSGKSMAKGDEFCRIIRDNTNRLLNLIGGILDLSKLESGSIKFENKKINVNSFINNLYTTYKYHNPEKKNLEFLVETGSPCTIIADENRVKEVLTNFLNNARKYTSSGRITLKCSFDGEKVVMAVNDTGIGIKPENIDKVFNRFEKLGSLVPGTGLGLTICKNIMNILKGDIGVESKFGEGSTFWISLPAKALRKKL